MPHSVEGKPAISKVMEMFEHSYKSIDSLLDPSNELRERYIKQVKTLYDLMKDFDMIDWKTDNSFKELLVVGFDNEQIWQQLELHNQPCLAGSRRRVEQLRLEDMSLHASGILKMNKFGNGPVREQDELLEDSSSSVDDVLSETILNGNNEAEDEEDVNDDVCSDNDSNDLIDDEDSVPYPVKKTYRASVVDDKFFKLGEMEEFLNDEDRKYQQFGETEVNEDSDISGQVDFFQALDDDDDMGDNAASAAEARYSDFFDPVQEDKPVRVDKQRNGLLRVDGPSVSRNVDDTVDSGKSLLQNEPPDARSADASSFEKDQEKVLRQIHRLEQANLSAKPWQLSGEASASQRPVNSLLEEHVTFEHTSAGAPVITEETTETLEDLIRRRIKDQAWDDVERKLKPTIQPFEYKKAPELNQEKSKLSLAEVYEREYVEQMKEEKEEKESEEHSAIRLLMQKLFVSLDALSNFHYTPKPPKPELKIVTNAPSLQMEEVTPITATDASLLAPEEVHGKQRDVVADSEKTAEDRKRARRQKKIKKKFASKEREKKAKLKSESGKVSKSSDKKKAIDKLKKNAKNVIVDGSALSDTNLKSSSQFFSKLQQHVRQRIDQEKAGRPEKRKTKQKAGKFLKL